MLFPIQYAYGECRKDERMGIRMSSMQSEYVRKMIRESGMWNLSLSEIRKNLEGMQSPGIPEGVKNTRVNIGGVDCEVFYYEEAKRDKVILYYHGGGFCLGIYPSNRDFVAGLAQRCKADIYMPDYRLAPENPYPAALEDASLVYRGLLDRGIKPENIVIMGDSSGGALSVSALLVLKEMGIPMPKALAYITPVFDLTGKCETFHTNREKDPFGQEDPLSIAKIYVGENDPSSPKLSPLFGKLEGLPPVLIHSAEHDVFAGDAERFARTVCLAGGKAEYKEWEEMWHTFHMQAAFVPEAESALEEMCSYMQKTLND
jgi:acetyl esterase/lipase